MAEWERRRVSGVPQRGIQSWQERWRKFPPRIRHEPLLLLYFFLRTMKLILPFSSAFPVPSEQRARAVLQLSCRRVYPTDSMLWCREQTGMPRSRDLEEVHETIRQDCRQSAHGLCERRGKGVWAVRQGRKEGQRQRSQSACIKNLPPHGKMIFNLLPVF